MKKICLFALFVCIQLSVYAQVKKLSIDHPPVVTRGEWFRISYEIKETVPDDVKIIWKETGAIRKKMGPSVSRSYSVINGKEDNTTRYTCIVFIEKEGEYTIPKLVLEGDDVIYESETSVIQVTAEDKKEFSKQADDVIVRVEFERDTIYDNEWVDAHIKIYSRNWPSQLNIFKPGAFDGFLIKEPEKDADIQVQKEMYNGEIYHTCTLMKSSLFPLHTGELSVKPGIYDLTTRGPRKIITEDNDFFLPYDTYDLQYKGEIKPASVYVKPSRKNLLPFIGVDIPDLSEYQYHLPVVSVYPHQTLMYVLDYSTSMLAEDFQPNRQEVVIETVLSAVELFREHEVGVIGFRRNGYLVSPLTKDPVSIRTALKEFQPADLPDGTAIGTSLALAIRTVLAQADKSPAIILFTDGENNCGFLSPQTAAELATLFNIRLYIIGVADEGEVKMPVKTPDGKQKYISMKSEINDELLTKISQATGGNYFRAKNNKELHQITEQVRKLVFSSITTSQESPRTPSKISPENARIFLDAIYVMNKQQ